MTLSGYRRSGPRNRGLYRGPGYRVFKWLDGRFVWSHHTWWYQGNAPADSDVFTTTQGPVTIQQLRQAGQAQAKEKR